MKKLYGAPTNEISQREMKNMEIARRAAREGLVLLKNDGALPLKSKKIALYGMGGRKTVKGGTGSGSVQERHCVSIEEGLENAGFIITTKQYLDDYDVDFASAHQEWHDRMDEKTASMPFMEAIGMVGILGEFQWPAGRRIVQKDIDASDTDTAIYVLARQAGEGSDRKKVAGDWYLSDDETANLALVASAYAHTIVVVNVGGQIDLGFMDQIKGIDALVYFVQGGTEGGNALADVLSGRYNFSGKLADSWTKRYEDLPFAMDYSYLNGNTEQEDYKEGIYVGYRYFDTFGVAPRYPFGFGLSYTHFVVESESVELNGANVQVTAKVTNTGTVYSGKEVVQVYLSCPGDREFQSLAAFAKTKELAPGEDQIITLEFNLKDTARYDETQCSWVLDAGNYLLRIGNSSRNTKLAAVILLKTFVRTEQCRSCCAPAHPLEELTVPARTRIEVPDVPCLTVDQAAFATITHDYTEPKFTESDQEARVLDSLTDEELVSLIKGGDLQARDPSIVGPLGTTGRTSLELNKKGVRNVAFVDGPAGLNLMEHAIREESGIEKPTSIPEKYNFGTFKQMAKAMIGTEGTHIYRYATAWPVELLLAQTWDVDILEQVGDGMGQELEEFGVTLLLAPGMNIHRNPLCGRNFEYFSEDPFLTGKFAAAQIRGTQAHKGVGLTVKHFCCNNQEDNRMGVSSNVNERALREIYSRGFEIAVRESQPLALMSSYNKLNGIYTANRHDLLTDILRCEWGFKGFVMTDWGSCGAGHGDPAQCALAGNDLVMPGTDWDREVILEGIQNGTIPGDALRRSAARVLNTVLNSGIDF